MQVYKILYRSIDNFRLIVPMASAGLCRHEIGMQWLPEFRPTLILYFESTTTKHEFELDASF